jgi:hypothetical protein
MLKRYGLTGSEVDGVFFTEASSIDENGIVIDASAPIKEVVDEILRRCQSGA